LRQDLYQPLRRAGVVDLIGEDMLFPTLPVAEEAYLTWARTHPIPDLPAPLDAGAGRERSHREERLAFTPAAETTAGTAADRRLADTSDD
jgi:hypothetical protein